MSKLTWLVTGCAGFIGSHVTQTLLQCGHAVVGLDNFTTGTHANLVDIRNGVDSSKWNLSFMEGDVRDYTVVQRATAGVDYVIHLAAQVSVAKSMEDPITTHVVNTDGFCNVLTASGASGIKRVVYASSCAVYGGQSGKLSEDTILWPKSPYAASKMINEVQARSFTSAFGLSTIGLRFFNVYGTRQDPDGAYSAVIPRWITAMVQNKPVEIYGTGMQTRDFVSVKDVVTAIITSALLPSSASGSVFNVGTGRERNLINLFSSLAVATGYKKQPVFLPARQGDVERACADTKMLLECAGLKSTHTFSKELKELVPWYRTALER